MSTPKWYQFAYRSAHNNLFFTLRVIRKLKIGIPQLKVLKSLQKSSVSHLTLPWGVRNECSLMTAQQCRVQVENARDNSTQKNSKKEN